MDAQVMEKRFLGVNLHETQELINVLCPNILNIK